MLCINIQQDKYSEDNGSMGASVQLSRTYRNSGAINSGAIIWQNKIYLWEPEVSVWLFADLSKLEGVCGAKCGSGVDPAYCYQKAAGSISLGGMSKRPWARDWTQTAPHVLVSNLHGVSVWMCVWITVSRFGQKCLLNALNVNFNVKM